MNEQARDEFKTYVSKETGFSENQKAEVPCSLSYLNTGSNLPSKAVTSAAPLQDRTASSSSGVWPMPDKLPPLLFFFSGMTTSAKQECATGWTFCNA
jgi:hypothetical protein